MITVKTLEWTNWRSMSTEYKTNIAELSSMCAPLVVFSHSYI